MNRAGLAGILGAAGSANIQDEEQQKLDVFADETFIRILSAGKSVAGIASEEQDDAIICGKEGRAGKYIVMMDPLMVLLILTSMLALVPSSVFIRITPLGEPLTEADFYKRKRASCSWICPLRFFNNTCLLYWFRSKWIYSPAVGEFSFLIRR